MKFGLALCADSPIASAVVPYFESLGMQPAHIGVFSAWDSALANREFAYLRFNPYCRRWDFFGTCQEHVGYDAFLHYAGPVCPQSSLSASFLFERMAAADVLLSYLRRCSCTATAAIVCLKTGELAPNASDNICFLQEDAKTESIQQALSAAEPSFLPRLLLQRPRCATVLNGMKQTAYDPAVCL